MLYKQSWQRLCFHLKPHKPGLHSLHFLLHYFPSILQSSLNSGHSMSFSAQCSSQSVFLRAPWPQGLWPFPEQFLRGAQWLNDTRWFNNHYDQTQQCLCQEFGWRVLQGFQPLQNIIRYYYNQILSLLPVMQGPDRTEENRAGQAPTCRGVLAPSLSWTFRFLGYKTVVNYQYHGLEPRNRHSMMKAQDKDASQLAGSLPNMHDILFVCLFV